MSKFYIIMYTKEYGRQEQTEEQYRAYDLPYSLHRENGPAVEFSSGDRFWHIDGKLHRIDGPAQEFASGDRLWHIEDKLHRTNGPAIERRNGINYWFVDSKEYSEWDFNILIEEVKNMSLAMRLTDPRWWVREWKD